MSNLHTPLPWKILKGNDYYIGNDRANIATVHKEHDAQLIASAPEMLEALENTLVILDRNPDREDIRRQQEYIMTVIAKAKGGK